MKKPISFILLNTEEQKINLNDHEKFIENMESSLLLSLLHQNKLTEWQYKECMKKLENNQFL